MDKLLLGQRRLFATVGFSFKLTESLMFRIYSWTSTASLAIIMVPESYFVYENLADIPLATDALCALLFCCTALPKVLTIHWYRAKLYSFFGTLQQLGRNGNCGGMMYLLIYALYFCILNISAKDSDRCVLEEAMRADRRIFNLFFSFALPVTVMYALVTFIQDVYVEIQTGNATWSMPIHAV